jgi:hypothetical protein
MTVSPRRLTLAAVVIVLSMIAGCAKDFGLPKCVFVDSADWRRLPDQPPEAHAMLLSIENPAVDAAKLLAEEAELHWFRSNDGQHALCYYSDPFCSPRQFTFAQENRTWAATQVDLQMCT